MLSRFPRQKNKVCCLCWTTELDAAGRKLYWFYQATATFRCWMKSSAVRRCPRTRCYRWFCSFITSITEKNKFKNKLKKKKMLSNFENPALSQESCKCAANLAVILLWREALHRDLHQNLPKSSNFFNDARQMFPSLFSFGKYCKSQGQNCMAMYSVVCFVCISLLMNWTQWPLVHYA